MVRIFRSTIHTELEYAINIYILMMITASISKKISSGLDYYDTTHMKNNNTSNKVTSYTFMNTVEMNK